MGRLAGFKYREVARRLRAFGWLFDRPGPGSHEVWRHPATGRKLLTALYFCCIRYYESVTHGFPLE
jgi:predicted RNA binding protein YcfA (HicA-like mRNA interferase family)